VGAPFHGLAPPEGLSYLRVHQRPEARLGVRQGTAEGLPAPSEALARRAHLRAEVGPLSLSLFPFLSAAPPSLAAESTYPH